MFTGKRRHYVSIRFCRALIHLWRLPHADTVEDWKTLATMSTTMPGHLHEEGINSYEDAVVARNLLRETLRRPSYNFLDLVCNVCVRN